MTVHAIAALVLLGSALAASAEPAAPAAQPTQAATGTVTAIPIPEIAQRAEQLTMLLRPAQTPDPSELRDAQLELTAAADWIHKRLVTTTDALASSPSANALANLADS